MKVKIGNKIYDAALQPIMLILDDTDKRNITSIASKAIKYCSFPTIGFTTNEIKEFMKIKS